MLCKLTRRLDSHQLPLECDELSQRIGNQVLDAVKFNRLEYDMREFQQLLLNTKCSLVITSYSVDGKVVIDVRDTITYPSARLQRVGLRKPYDGTDVEDPFYLVKILENGKWDVVFIKAKLLESFMEPVKEEAGTSPALSETDKFTFNGMIS